MANKTSKQARSRGEEAQIEQAFRDISPKSGKPKKQRKPHTALAIFAISFAIVAICLAMVAGYYFFSDANLDGVILENITVAGVNVGGMTQRDAIVAVEAATANTYGRKTMVVTVLDTTAELPATCCSALDIPAAVKAAYRYGHSGSRAQRQEQQEIAMTQGHVVDIIPYLTLDENAINKGLETIGKKYSTTLTQSSYEIKGKAPNQTLVIHLGSPEYGLNMQDLYRKVLNAYCENRFALEGHCDIIEPEPIDLQSIYDEHYVAPVNAAFNMENFDIISGKNGYGFDLKKAEIQVSNAQYGSTVEIPFLTITPEITDKKLTATLYQDQLSTYTTHHVSESNRDVNLSLACKAIDGTILYPDETFSYNGALGERTEERGYRAGGSFSGGEVVKTVGGGICQVSSTLYYCALVADLEILTRENHGFDTGYVPLGMDATVSWDTLDFCFTNNLDYPIRIDAKAVGGSVTVTICGTDTKDYYVEMEYEVLHKTEYETTYKTLPEDNEDGYKDGDVIVSPATGYRVKTYRCRYNKTTKQLISKDFEAISDYSKRDKVICKIETQEEHKETAE